MPQSPQTLAQKVRAKYPGVYDDLSDADLEAKVRAKFPGVYDDIPLTSATTATTASEPTTALGTVGDVLTGVGKGALNTVIGLGQMAYDYVPGVSQVSDAVQSAIGGGPAVPAQQLFEQARRDVAPTNTPQAIGFHGEQIGEFFVPVGGAAGKIGKLGEIAKVTGLSRAQTGSDAQAGVAGALSAAVPAAGKLTTLARHLKEGAQKSVVRALGPTKEAAKATAAKIAPTMLEKGVGGSRQAMLERASAEVSQVGNDLGAAVQAAAQQGTTIPSASVAQALKAAQQAVTTTTARGRAIVVPGAGPVVDRLQKLEAFVTKLGPDIPIDKAQHVKQVMDRIVSKAGLYGQRAGANATDSAAAWATREAASAIRQLINTASPDIAMLNQEYAFWKGLKDVLTQTELRTQAQGGGLVSSIAGVAGAVSGMSSGGILGALGGSVLGRELVALMQSPAWRTRVSAPLKNALADALAHNRTATAYDITRKILQSVPAQVRTVEAQ